MANYLIQLICQKTSKHSVTSGGLGGNVQYFDILREMYTIKQEYPTFEFWDKNAEKFSIPVT
jgi:hypothetical protein